MLLRRNLSVRACDRQDLFDTACEGLLCALGYERRSSFAVLNTRTRAGVRTAVGFPDNQVLSYERNASELRSAGLEVQEVAEDGFRAWFRKWLDGLGVANGVRRVFVDISSMTRTRLAAIVLETCLESGSEINETTFLYSPATYTKPGQDPGVIESCGPVMAEFAGWSEDSERAVAAIVGVGYEPEKALGVIEYLEPGPVWAYRPIGRDNRYLRAVNQANRLFFDTLDSQRIINYEVARPVDTLLSIESLVFGQCGNARPVIVPLGPKVFALIALLVACQHYPRVGVWRVSSGASAVPVERRPSGEVVAIRVRSRADAIVATEQE